MKWRIKYRMSKVSSIADLVWNMNPKSNYGNARVVLMIQMMFCHKRPLK